MLYAMRFRKSFFKATMRWGLLLDIIEAYFGKKFTEKSAKDEQTERKITQKVFGAIKRIEKLHLELNLNLQSRPAGRRIFWLMLNFYAATCTFLNIPRRKFMKILLRGVSSCTAR